MRHLVLAAAVSVALVLGPSAASATVRVVATTTDLADIAGAVGGDLVRVEAICAGAQDPHFVQARPSYMVTLSRADLLVSVGLDLEVGWLPSLIAGARNPRIAPGGDGYFEAASVVTPIGVVTGAIDRSAGDVHPDGNPHYWLDPHNAGPIARGIAEALSRVDAGNAGAYRANAEAFAARVEARLEGWAAALAPHRGAEVVSYHQTFDYLLARYGLVVVGVVEDRPGIQPSPAHVADLTRLMRDRGVRVILNEVFFDASVSQRIAADAGARVLVLPTSVGGVASVDDYVALIDHLVAALASALEEGP